MGCGIIGFQIKSKPEVLLIPPGCTKKQRGHLLGGNSSSQIELKEKMRAQY